MKKDLLKMYKKKNKNRPPVDYSAYHNVQQAWKMKILKYYSQIEDNEKLYVEFAKKLFDNKIPKEQLEQINKLMRKNDQIKRKQWEERKTKGALPFGIKFRKIFS